MRYLLYIVSGLLFLNCNKTVEEKGITYFGGQIINPKSDKVVVYKNDKPIDSAKLDTNHKFLIALDSITTGLYTFNHGNEMQYLFLEPMDSLLFRLNTWDFDESLVFSGKGAERNNFLINLFLINEKENRAFFDYYKLDQLDFEKKIDSSIQVKTKLYEQFKEELINVSPSFDKLINITILYPLYRIKEAYPYRHKKALKLEDYPHTDPSFYRFRKDIDINDEELFQYYAYSQYIEDYIHHLAYEKQLIDNYQTSFYYNFMKAAYENIKSKTIKDKFLYHGALLTLMDESASTEEKEDTKKLFFDNETNESFKNEISNLLKASEKLPIGSKLPNIELYAVDSKKVNIADVLHNKKTIIYTWPTGLYQIDNCVKRVSYLEKNYPEYFFVGINSKNSDNKWKQQILSKITNQNTQFNTNSTEVDWLNVSFSRAIIIDQNGIVQNNLTHLNNPNFEKQLKKIKNQ